MDAVRAIVRREFGAQPVLRVRREHGGSVASCFRVDFPNDDETDGDDAPSLFVKIADELRICEQEAKGLEALRATGAVRVPQVHRIGRMGNTAYLILEFIVMRPPSSGDYATLGTAIGKLHAYRHKAHTNNDDDEELERQRFFGFEADNYIGTTAQKNTPRMRNWVAFFRVNRLEFQLSLLKERQLCADRAFLERVQQVANQIHVFFDPKEQIQPSLLHGDLWQGNWGFTMSDGAPVIFDPACYWGHSESELAMMTLFGFLPDPFYVAYEKEMPRAKRFADREPLYQLYHALNHFNMFGAGFQSLCEELLTQLEATIARRRVDDADQVR